MVHATRVSSLAHENHNPRDKTPSTPNEFRQVPNTEDHNVTPSLFNDDAGVRDDYPSKTSSPCPEGPIHRFYLPQDNEVSEVADLLVPGEQSSDDVPSTSSDNDDIPVRRLSDWAIYREDTRELVPFRNLCKLGDNDDFTLGPVVASGNVRPESCSDSDSNSDSLDDNDEDDSILDSCSDLRVALSALVDMNIYNYEDDKLDSKIWIRTEHAWYILEQPSEDYLAFFRPFYVAHCMIYNILSFALGNPRATYQEFVDGLQDLPLLDGDAIPVSEMLGRHLQEADLNDATVKHCHHALWLLQKNSHTKLKRVPLIKYLMDLRSPSTSELPPLTPLQSSQHRRPPAIHQVSNLERGVLLHRSDTIVTPTILHVAAGLFHSPLQLAVDHCQQVSPPSLPFIMQPIHHSNPKHVVWGAQTNHGRYMSVTMDGTSYKPGDFVILESGEDTDKTRAAFAMKPCTQSSNSLANHWFAKIAYLFEEKGVKSFHAQWFVHGSKTILQELAHPRGLFLYDSRDSCQDLPLSCIYQKCNLHYIPPTAPEPSPDPSGPPNNFFYRDLTYSEDSVSFTVHSESTVAEALDCCDKGGFGPCFSCGIDLLRDHRNELHIASDNFSYLGSTYHIHDFVYLQASPDPDGPYQIAQILDLCGGRRKNDFKILVQLLARHDDIVRREQRNGLGLNSLVVKDERRLYITLNTSTVPYSRIAGKCYAQHSKSIPDLQQWLCEYDHFHIEDKAKLLKIKTSCDVEALHPTELEICHDCLHQRQSDLRKQDTMLSETQPLQGLELFAGAGGLSTGFDLSGHVDTQWLVEFSPACALTLKHNKQKATVYNQDCNLLLEHAILTSQGANPAPLKSSDGIRVLSTLPKPGEVDLLPDPF
ncbi:hypothetical protein OF83DRAFT_1291445 [Amylostereum chailletii]|nr:hypothetical protein OF83DRAFT_1291445 [Amylostereum chailletii]